MREWLKRTVLKTVVGCNKPDRGFESYLTRMKKDTNYIQCALQKNNFHHMAWIPEKFAVKGRIIRIEEDDGWEVVGVSDGVVKSAKEADAQSQLYKKTRKASDI